jgi:hypothetical protein
LQDRLNREQREIFSEIFRPSRSNIDLAFANVLEAGKFATATEVKVRENARLAAVERFPAGQEFSGSAQQFNFQAIASARRAIGVLREAREQVLSELGEAHARDAFRASLSDSREALVQALSKFNVDPEDFREVLGIWDETSRVASERGAEGLHERIVRNLETFIEQRKRPNRGNQPHSPLPWWKYVLIAVYIGAAVFAVVACFVWSACTWVWSAISATAPWLFKIIEMGC